jgi:diguanylate cyclase (GGDEF)-like protein/putative nucleotidyltransferase with HDIG domain
MNIYSIFPLVAIVVYIPLIITSAGSRPWQKRHALFILFLLSAMMWSLIDYVFRGNYFPQYNLWLFKAIVIAFPVMAVQFHVFASTFYEPGRGRWLPFAYISLAIIIILVFMGYIPESIRVDGDKLYPIYGKSIFIVGLPLVILIIRGVYVLTRRLKQIENPVLYNQIISILLGVGTLTIFTLASFLPVGREYPIAHFGNILNASILSYAVIRHRLVDIRFVIRQGTAWVGLAIVGTFSFWLLLVLFHNVFDFNLDPIASIVATLTALVVAIFVYKVRGYFFDFMSRAFQGSSYNYRRRLNEFTNKIHNVFSLKEQGGELLTLLNKAINVRQSCLLFPEAGSEDFNAQFVEPRDKECHLTGLRLRAGNPIIKYLEREQRPLSRENLTILPAFLGLWPQEKEEIESKEIALFVPLISRDRLIAILVLGRKHSGRYSLEDFNVIEDVTNRVAVSLEKEYLSEQLREREEELSVINNSSAIMSSSLDIQEIFGSFIEELKKVVDVSWATIVLIGENDYCCVALSSPEGSAYQVGERVPLEGTGTGWVVSQKKSFVEYDLSKERYFSTGEQFYELGLRTMVYLPLIAKGNVIGSFIVASKMPNAYNQRHIKLLEQLASQISMPLENSQLYAKAEKKARIDELTSLLNRRSLDEMIDSEISRHSRYGGVFTLAILDLDSFKQYNDRYGHLSGDRLLKEVGRIIKSVIRNSDYAFRYGGDEFATLLPQTNIDDALQVIERVRKKIAKDLASGEIHVTTSIGLASWPDDGISHTDIIAAADVTLYRAKRSGGNRSFCASGTMSTPMMDDSGEGLKSSADDKITGIINAFSETADSKNVHTHDHSRKVAEYSLVLAKSLKLKADETKQVEVCALLHDIGKISISDTILEKTDEYSDEELETLKNHSQIGADIASRIPQMAACADGILHHHECYDGTGYPDGLMGEEIPLISRIIAITDAFVNMVFEKPEPHRLSLGEAITELKRHSGSQFDPHLVERFVATFEKNAAGVRKKTRR